MQNTRSAVLLLCLLLVSVAVSGQGRRGGGRGAGGVEDPGAPPIMLTSFDSDEYGLKFPAPPEMSVFTPAHPGNFRQIFTERRIVYLVDLMGKSASVLVKYLPGATDGDVKGLKAVYEGNPPQAKLPEYKKVSLAMIKIGAGGEKDALEFVYVSKENDTVKTTRQVMFAHKGNGFIVTCAAPEKDFGAIDKKSFQPLFATIEFK